MTGRWERQQSSMHGTRTRELTNHNHWLEQYIRRAGVEETIRGWGVPVGNQTGMRGNVDNAVGGPGGRPTGGAVGSAGVV